MSNPAPTLNQINAFNATQGTTIDFNIIGGTEVIRSNKIYIYDLSDNSLICTHLYVSTESIHELPANTDSSIVYESGKSSADFVNGAQYYAQIQTFTDTAGTQGGSGLSVAKMFWCLVDPTLTITTIPSTISTTSYNVSATYNANTSVVSNIIQQYQFSLYSATGSLLQSSGVVVGSGEQQGTSTAYDISYNFSGLSVGSSYYVVVDVTTTQGMNVSVQSNTFTVSIDTPTLGEATVVNNACDGYISVTSNLSGEYGGSASGEIASFVTSSINDVASLKVNLEPVQNCTPWMSAQDTEPYMFRAVPTQTEDFEHESDTIVGGTVGWNQYIPNYPATTTINGVTFTNNGDSITVNGTATGGDAVLDLTFGWPINGVYFLHGCPSGGSTSTYYLGNLSWFDVGNGYFIKDTAAPSGHGFRIYVKDGVTVSNKVFVPQATNITQMFGSTIADYVYSIRANNEGAMWLRANAPQLFEYHAYDAGSLVSVSGLTSHDMVGFNQWDEEWEQGDLAGGSGVPVPSTNYIRSKDFCPCLPSTAYCLYAPIRHWIFWYDAEQNWIANIGGGVGAYEYTSPPNAKYFKITAEGGSYNNNICVNLSDPSLNGTYKPYTKHSYPLDSTLTLRGKYVLNNGKLKHDGDEYRSNGNVTRKYVDVDLTSLTFTTRYTGTNNKILSADIGGFYLVSEPNFICAKYPYVRKINGAAELSDVDNAVIGCYSYSSGTHDFSLYIVLPVNESPTGHIQYKSEVSTTETADPFTNPQVVDPSGTEEYVGSPIPVGHNTTYQRICPITGWTGCEVSVAGKNLFANNLFYVGYASQLWENGFNSVNIVQSNNGFKTQVSDSYGFGAYLGYLRAGVTYTISFSQTGIAVGQTFSIRKTTTNQLTTTSGVSATRLDSKAITTGANYLTFTTDEDCHYWLGLYDASTATSHEQALTDVQLEFGSTVSDFVPYTPTTIYPVSWQTEAGTVYGGTVDLVTGVLTVTHALLDMSSGSFQWSYDGVRWQSTLSGLKNYPSRSDDLKFERYGVSVSASSSTEGVGFTVGGAIYIYTSNNTDAPSGNVWYPLAQAQTYQLDPVQVQTLLGQNNVWSDAGDVEITYNIPITNLLVKRQDVADVSGAWLTLYSQPITQASDMDFTFIDFLNQYGKTYKYALVPLLTQTQSGVVVQIEGGYTVSDNVDSIFDGVYIADQTNVERVKAGVGYGNIDMNQGVGSITPIGSKYPIVITNSQNQYHNGSVRGTIVPNDFYSNGNLSRIDMVNKRDELEQFLTNKRAKIIKDWNGKMWLVMIMSNVACSFDDNYGMGMVSFSADWLEVGDPTNQQDLYNAGLINVGGV